MTNRPRSWAHSGLHPTAARRLTVAPPTESLVFTLRSDDEADVVTLGVHHPIDWLTASLAPAACRGLLVVAPGFVCGRTPRQPVVVAHEVRTDGSERSWIEWEDGSISAGLHGGDGRVPDVMRRSLGLPTPPPCHPVGWFWLAVWMADVLVLAPGTDAREAARWHPAVDPREIDEVADHELVAFIVQRHLDHARVTDWSVLRVMAMDDALGVGHITPAVAAWYDDGSFCRFVVDHLPPMTELTGAASALLHPTGVALVDSVADAVPRHG